MAVMTLAHKSKAFCDACFARVLESNTLLAQGHVWSLANMYIAMMIAC